MRNQAHICIAVAILAAGCVSMPTPRYYTLDMTPSGGARIDVNFGIERVRTSEALTRRNILIKKNLTEIEYYARDQWSATLGEIVGQKLKAEFEAGIPPKGGTPNLYVSGIIVNFEQVDVAGGAEAHACIDLLFIHNQNRSLLLKKTYDATVPAESNTAGAVVCALSRCVEKIAAEVAADANRLKL